MRGCVFACVCFVGGAGLGTVCPQVDALKSAMTGPRRRSSPARSGDSLLQGRDGEAEAGGVQMPSLEFIRVGGDAPVRAFWDASPLEAALPRNAGYLGALLLSNGVPSRAGRRLHWRRQRGECSDAGWVR